MTAIIIGALWAAYTLGLWGVILIKGWDVTLKELLSTTWPPPSGTDN